MKHSLSILFVSSLLFFSCLSNSLPQWTRLPPSDSDYFIGIGNSNLRNKGIDYEMALQKARADLARSIGVTVQSESELRSYRSGELESESLFEKITESVEKHLELVEVVDSWYSRREGWWFMLRIHRESWFDLLKQRRGELIRTTLSFLERPASGTAEIYRLLDAVDRISRNPYGEDLYYRDDSGDTVELTQELNSRLETALSRLGIGLADSGLSLRFGFPAVIRFDFNQTETREEIPVCLRLRGQMAPFQCGILKRIGDTGELELTTQALPVGFHLVEVFLDPGSRRIADMRPLKIGALQVESLPAVISFEEDFLSSAVASGAIRKQLYDMLPIQPAAGGDPDLYFRLELIPRNVRPGKPFYAGLEMRLYGSFSTGGRSVLLLSETVEREAGPDASFVYRKLDRLIAQKLARRLTMENDRIRQQLEVLYHQTEKQAGKNAF